MNPTPSQTMQRVNVSDDHVETRMIKTSRSASNMDRKKEKLMGKLVDFYKYLPHLEQLLPILLKKSKVSLRILDWFVTNYSKPDKANEWPGVVYNISLYGKPRRFNVYDSYKSQLDAYHKKLFDPFCRRGRIYFEYDTDCEIETTPGQLNFFRWAIQNHVLEYVEQNLEKISHHMSLHTKQPTKDEDQPIQISAEIQRNPETSTITTRIDFSKRSN